MPTTVVKTIGATSSPTTPDYTSLAAWKAGCPANLVTADEIWEGQCLNQGEFTSASTLLTLSGITTDATRFVRLTTAAGASFRDNAGVRTNPLNYDATKGVGIRCTGAYTIAISAAAIANCEFDNLQIEASSNSASDIIDFSSSAAATLTMKDCLVVSKATGRSCVNSSNFSNTFIAYNSLFVATSATVSPLATIACTVNVIGCTVISKSGVSPITANPYVTPTVIDTAMFGGGSATKALSVGSASLASCNHNATDSATAVGSANQTSLTFASQFVSTTTDFRAASGGALPNNGATNSNILVDISGTTRSLTTPTIGCWEVTSPPPPSVNFRTSLSGIGGRAGARQLQARN